MKRTTQGAAARLLLAPATLANWRSQGRGPRYLRMGGKILYDDADLDAYEASCRQTSTAENRREADVAVAPQPSTEHNRRTNADAGFVPSLAARRASRNRRPAP